MNKRLLPMHLQFFAENDDEKKGDSPEGSENSAEENEKDEPIVKVAEMKRRIEKEQEKYEEKIKELNQSIEERINTAVEKAQKEATLTGKELQEYKEQEAQRKIDEANAEIERLKKENVKRDLRDQAIKTLSEKELPVTDKVLNFVVKDTAEDTLSAIDDISELLKEQKNKYAQTEPPVTSGGFNAKPEGSVGSILDKAKITKY